MPKSKIITGQHISPELKSRARVLRRNMTPAEEKLWQQLRAGRLEGFHFRRQQIIDRFIVDFYCHAVDIVVEVDGSVHLDQQEYDQERDIYLTDLGLTVLRFTNNDINQNLETVLATILQACQQPASPPDDRQGQGETHPNPSLKEEA